MCKVSVIMPAYNSIKYIKKSIQSIINQTFTEWELLVIDDGSTDGTREYLQTLEDQRIKVLFNEQNMGVAFTRNRGLEIAKGEYIAFLDSDDIAELNRLKVCTDFLDVNPNIDLVQGLMRTIDENDSVIHQWTKETLHNYKYIKAMMLLQNVICTSSVMIRKSVQSDNNIFFKREFERVGVEDYMFWNDYLVYGNASGIDVPMLNYRVLNDSLSHAADQDEKEMKIDDLHCKAFDNYGLKLPDDVKKTLLIGIRERNYITNLGQLLDFFESLKGLIKEAERKEFPYVDELKIACKKRLIGRINESDYMWE